MKLQQHYLTSLLCLFSSMLCSAQTTGTSINEIKQQPLKIVQQEAEKLYEEGAYEAAFPYYKALSEMKKRLRTNDVYRLGKTALAAKNYPLVQEKLGPLLQKAQRYPLIQYEYALALKYLGEYVLASQHFQSYLNTHQNEYGNDYVELAQIHQQTCSKALKEKEKTSAWFMDDLVSDTSSNDDGNIYRALSLPSKYKIGLVECQTPKGTCIMKVYPDNSIETLQGSVGNPIFNSCSPYIAPDGETVFFAQQEPGKAEYKIFIGTISPEGEIENIKKLGSGVNREGYSSTHPTIGLTEHGQQILYFASTLPGSKGGYDIWYSIRTIDGDFTMSYNLGTRVNGTGDEVTPFYYQNGGTLYFSSEKAEGYGGLDVYEMTGEKKRWEGTQATHLKMPVNSKGNDFHYKKNSRGKGSFSTDRTGKEKTVKYTKRVGP